MAFHSFASRSSSLFLIGAGLCLAACGKEEPSPHDDAEEPVDNPEGTGGQGGASLGGAAAVGGAPQSGGESGLLEEPPPVPTCPESDQGYAVEVVSHEFGEGQDFGQDEFPDPILGGPQGRGCCAGALDVVSLGDGGSVVLGFGERVIVDGPGVDFIVSENAFWAGGDESSPVAELARVSVSADGENWLDFSCEPGDAPPFGSCAGWRPVLASVLDPMTDPFDPETAGGDQYDLADVGLDEVRYVRIVDLPGDDAVFDLDAVTVIQGACQL